MSVLHRHCALLASAWLIMSCGDAVEAGRESTSSRTQALTAPIPGRIEAEAYQRAFDSTPGVNYGAYNSECDRGDGVDIDRSYDPSDLGCAIGWTTAGEWLEYDIELPVAQSLRITARVATPLLGRTFHLSVDGITSYPLAVPISASWAYADVATDTNFVFSAGKHVLRVTFDTDAIDLNYLDVTRAATPPIETLLEATSAVASSQESSLFPASFAIDGDSSTRWSSEFSDPQSITLDLGAEKQVSRAVLNWEVAASRSYRIEVSDDSAGPWAAVYSTTTGDGGIDDVAFPPVTARYVRLYSSERTTYFGNSLYDFDVYGEVATAPDCVPEIADTPDDGALLPTGSLPGGSEASPLPAPILEPAFTAPTSSVGCLRDCFKGSVLDGDLLVATAAAGGTVHTFVKSASGAWTAEAPLSNPSGSFDTTFGMHLALDGDELLVTGTATVGTPEVYVFRRLDSAWRLQQVLPVLADRLVLDDGTALIANSQDVRAYRRGESGSYRLQSIFSSPTRSTNVTAATRFGARLALDKNVALIAAPSQGSVYIYTRCGKTWSFKQALQPSDSGISFGWADAVGVSGPQIAVGASTALVGQGSARPGAVVLYERTGEAWLQTSTIANPLADSVARDFGAGLALRNHLLLVSYRTPYITVNPFPPPTYNFLFDISGAPRFITALHSGGGETVNISGPLALVDVKGVSPGGPVNGVYPAGTTPTVFALSP